MRRLLLLGAALAMTGCMKTPLLPIDRGPGKPLVSHAASGRDTLRSAGEHLYLTAILFADGYDWRRDTLPEERDARIAVLRDGKEILRVPALGSIDPDRHRFREGHLYQDFVEGDEVVVLRDGAPRLRYRGPEILRGFLVHRDTVYSLGQDPGGTGIRLRINGETAFEDPSGQVFGPGFCPERPDGALTLDQDHVCFSYAVPFKDGSRTLREYRTVRDGICVQTVPAGTVWEMSDIRMAKGRIWRLERRTSDSRALTLSCDRDLLLLPLGPEETAGAGRLVVDGERILARYRVSGPSGSRVVVADGDSVAFDEASLWEQERVLPGHVREIGLSEGVPGWVATGEDGEVSCFGVGEATWEPEEGLRLMDSRCMLLRAGHLVLALTGSDGRSHAVYIDNHTSSYHFNGYFSSLCWE